MSLLRNTREAQGSQQPADDLLFQLNKAPSVVSGFRNVRCEIGYTKGMYNHVVKTWV